MRSIHHTGSTVSSFERSLDFCVEILGMDVAVALAPRQHGPQLDGMFGLDGAVMRAAMLRAG